MELQQLPNCQNEQWKPTRSPAHFQVSFEIGPLGGAADINRSIPSSPLQHRAEQLMLLPPEWAPCQTRQWQTEADKRQALQYRKSAGDARWAQKAHYCPCSADTRDSFPIVTDWVKVSSHYHLDSHLQCYVSDCRFTHRCCDCKYWLCLMKRPCEAWHRFLCQMQHYSSSKLGDKSWVFVLSLRKGGASGLAQPFCKLRLIWHWNEIGRPW